MTKPRRVVLIDSTGEHGEPYRVCLRYDAAMIEHIKSVFPKIDRRYDPATKAWFVASWWLDALIDAFCGSGYDVKVDGETGVC
jgi:hypothetical protein